MSEWQPIEDGSEIDSQDGGHFFLRGQKLVVTGTNKTGYYHTVKIELPDDIRLCRRVPASPDLLSACESALAMLDELFPADIFTGESGDPGAALIAENRARLQAAIAQAKGE